MTKIKTTVSFCNKSRKKRLNTSVKDLRYSVYLVKSVLQYFKFVFGKTIFFIAMFSYVLSSLINRCTNIYSTYLNLQAIL